MEHIEQRIGRIDPIKGKIYPPLTLSGAPCPQKRLRGYTPPSTRGLGGDAFVVLDAFPPRGFDLEAAVAECAAFAASDSSGEVATEQVPETADYGDKGDDDPALTEDMGDDGQFDPAPFGE